MFNQATMGGNSTSCRRVLGIVRKSHLSAPGGRCSLKIEKKVGIPTGPDWVCMTSGPGPSPGLLDQTIKTDQ